jgi:hypothetical protein
MVTQNACASCVKISLRVLGWPRRRRQSEAAAEPTPVIASEAKQSIGPQASMDCFVALLPCANASRLSQAMTAVAKYPIQISNSQFSSEPVILRSAKRVSKTTARLLQHILRGSLRSHLQR